MSRIQYISWSIAAWIAVGFSWFVITRNYHPRLSLAIIVTTSLITTYAVAAFVNHLVLIPRYLRAGRTASYAFALLGMMVTLTAVTLLINRGSYIAMLGPDPDPNGLYKHYAIDFAGMAAHLMAAAIVVWIFNQLVRA